MLSKINWPTVAVVAAVFAVAIGAYALKFDRLVELVIPLVGVVVAALMKQMVGGEEES